MHVTKTSLPIQHGMILLEGLIAILIFSFGVLALVGLQAASIKNIGDAKYRADASFLANQLIGRMWADRTNLLCYSHQPTGVCASAASKANLESWLADVSKLLPGATEKLQQVSIGTDNQVIVTLVWRAAQDAQPHKFVVAAHING